MVDVRGAALPILLWLAACVYALSRGGTRAVTRAWLVGIFSMLAVASSLSISAVTAGVAQVSGVLSLADAIERTGVIGAGFCAQSLLRRIREPDRGQFSWRSGRSRALTIALGVLWAAFVVGNVRGSEVFGSFARPEFWPTVYMAVFLGYMAYVLLDVMIGCWHYASSAGGALGVGLRFMAAGCASALMYVAFKVAALALVDLGPRMPAFLESTFGRTDVVLAGVVVVCGASLPVRVRARRATVPW